MRNREVIGTATTPDGEQLILSKEGDDYIFRMGGVTLMSSRTYGSEQTMAPVAAEALGPRPRPRVLVGGLGMGYTLRAALDTFGSGAQIVVSELLPAVVYYNRGVLAELAGRPLDDPRVQVIEGDVRGPLRAGGWDVVLLDVDNGPDPFTTSGNASLYSNRGVALLADSLAHNGVLVVWSAFASPPFVERLRRAGLRVREERVYARPDVRKGARHTLFVAERR